MQDFVNFVATAEGFAHFGISQDPAASIAQIQPHCPLPIELLAGWILPAHLRGQVLNDVTKSLTGQRTGGEWFRLRREKARELLAKQAEKHGGKPWRVRLRPVTEMYRAPGGEPRAIVTPYGRFHSAAEAARAIGVSRAAVSQKALRRTPGWRYIDDGTPQPPLPRLGRPPIKDDFADDQY